MNKKAVIPPTLRELDETLYESVKDIDILSAIAPQNYQQEKQAFFGGHCKTNPKFSYEKTDLNLFSKKRELFNLPIETIKSKELYRLYSEVIQSYVDKLDQFRHIGTEKFLYDSLRYYGEPSAKDIRNAEYLLHITDQEPQANDDLVGANEIKKYFESFAAANNYPLTLTLEDSMIANALVSGDIVKINTQAKVSKPQLRALAHHELGVHLATTLNAQAQPLKILVLGSPVNTTTQEGLALLCEYLSGFMTLDRFRMLALRVIAVNSMIIEKDFKRTFSLLVDQHGVSTASAFAISSRVYRGGGFTKDYLYLKGFQQILVAYQSKQKIHNLLCGKVSFEHLQVINKLIEQGYLIAPKHISPAIRRPVPTDPVLKFIAQAIK